MNKNVVIKKIVNKFSKYSKIFLSAHKRPDGDAMSSSYGLALALKRAFPKKDIKVIANIDEYISLFPYLKFNENMFINPNTKVTGKYLAIIGDTSTQNRIQGYDIFKNAATTICFDHHKSQTNLKFDIFWSEPNYSASSMQAIEIANSLLKKMDEQIALYLIIGVYTDTNFFKYSFADPLPLTLVAGCLKYIKNETINNLFNNMAKRNILYLKLARFVYKHVKIKNNFAYVIFNKSKVAKFKRAFNVGKCVYMIANLQGISKWAFFTYELEDNVYVYKAHLRSNGPSVLEVAKKYDGGGHNRAAGCKATSKAMLKKMIYDLSNVKE